MTWTKFGAEFFDDCAEAGLSDAAVRTHTEAIGWIYNQELMACTIKKSTMRRWAGSRDYWQAITAELVPAGWWQRVGDDFIVLHHADVIRQSLTSQTKKRDTERDRQQKKRHTVPVGANVGTNVGPTQTDRQTSTQTGTNDGLVEADPVTGEVHDLSSLYLNNPHHDPWAA